MLEINGVLCSLPRVTILEFGDLEFGDLKFGDSDTAVVDQTRHKKSRRAKPRNWFYREHLTNAMSITTYWWHMRK